VKIGSGINGTNDFSTEIADLPWSDWYCKVVEIDWTIQRPTNSTNNQQHVPAIVHSPQNYLIRSKNFK
jgi:hypothetical protein